MRKICCFILLLSFVSVLVSACNIKKDEPMVNAPRRLGKYIQTQEEKPGGTVDLSEGPKLKYDAYFGPKALNFDFKIEDPY